MNKVKVTKSELIIEPQGLDKVFSFTSKLSIPLAHVRGATFDPGFNQEPKGIRAPGLGLPGKWSGTFILHGEKSFWNVSNTTSTVVIQLKDEKYVQLIVTVENPKAVVDSINTSIAG
jgi:hypothetical protein